MVAAQHYDVRINSSDGGVMLKDITNVTTVLFDYVDNHSVVTFKVNITVVDINGQRSESTVIEIIIEMSNIISSKYIAS